MVSAGFYIYALLVAPSLARVLKSALDSAQAILWPGFLLLVIMLVEPFALFWKARFLRRRNAESGFRPHGPMLGISSAAGIGHVLVTVFLGMVMLDAWGVVGVGTEQFSSWWGLAIVALVLKDFAGLLAMGGQGVSREAPGHWKEQLADGILLVFSCVAYTVWWSVIVDLEAVSGVGLGRKLALLPVLGAVFAFFYLPLRLPLLLEEYYLHSAKGRNRRLGMELAIGAILGLYPVFF